MHNLNSWELWQQEVLDVYICVWIPHMRGVGEMDNTVVRVLEQTKYDLQRPMLSPPSLAIRNVCTHI
jgi:hypothetical protein